MIFQTFESESDSFISNFGIFGKSFETIANRINKAKNELLISDDFTPSNILNAWKNSANKKDFSDKFFVTQDDIKGSLLDIDELFPDHTDKDFNNIIQKLKDVNDSIVNGQTGVKSAQKVWEEYFSQLESGEKWQKQLVENNKLIVNTSADVKKAFQNSKNAAIQYNTSLNNLTIGAKIAKIALDALKMAGNMLAAFVISELVDGVIDFVNASSEISQQVKDLSDDFAETKSSIDGYKTKIEELNEIINDSESSYDDVTEARKNLLEVQDLLIEKYGTEKKNLGIITDAIYDQADALDYLTQKEWQRTKNEMNDNSGGKTGLFGWIKSIPRRIYNWYHGYEDNVDGAIKEYGEYTVEIPLEFVPDYQKEDFSKKLTELGATIEEKWISLDTAFSDNQIFTDVATLSGNATEMYNTLVEIQNLDKDFSFSSFFKTDLTNWANEAKNLSTQYKDFYKQYTLQEKILSGEKDVYAQSYKNLIDKYDAYQDALVSRDKGKQEKALKDYSEALQAATDEALENGDEDVKDYFTDMFPAIQTELDRYNFKMTVVPEIDISELQGKRASEVFEMKTTDGTQEGETAFDSILEQARQQGLVSGTDTEQIKQMVNLLVEWRVLQADIKTDAEETQKSYNAIVSKVHQKLSNEMDIVDGIYADIYNKKDFDWSSILNNENFNKAFGDLGESYSNFIETVTNNPKDIKACQTAFNNLTTEYIIQSGALDNLTADTANASAQMLTEMGVKNSSAIVTAALAKQEEELALNKILLTNSSNDLENVTVDEINTLLTEGVITEDTASKIAGYALQKQYCNGYTVTTSADCQNIYNLAAAAGAGVTALVDLQRIKQKFANSKDLSDAEINSLNQEIQNILTGVVSGSGVKNIPFVDYIGGSKTAAAKKSATKEAETKLKESIENYMSYLEASLDSGRIDYKEYCDTVKKYLEDLYNSGKLKLVDYYTYLKQMLEKQKSIYDSVLSAVSNLYDKKIKEINKQIDAVEKENTALEKQKTLYENAADAIQNYYQILIDNEESTKDALEKDNDKLQDQVDNYDSILAAVDRVYEKELKANQEAQDAIQDKIDALNDANDAQDLQYRKAQAYYELQKSLNSKTKKLYTDAGGYIYTQDEEAVRDARQNLEDIKTEEIINGLEKEKEALADAAEELEKYRDLWADIADTFDQIQQDTAAQEQWGSDFEKQILENRLGMLEAFKEQYLLAKKTINDNTDTITSIDEKIEQYEKEKDAWNGLSNAIQDNVNKQAAAQLFGADWEKQLNDGRLISFEEFKEQYLNIQSQIDNNDSLIQSYNEKVTYYENLKEKWSDIANAYQQSVDARNAAALLGANWETDVLSGNLKVLENYKTDYVALQNEIVKTAEYAANARIKASNAANAAEASSGQHSPINIPPVNNNDNTVDYDKIRIPLEDAILRTSDIAAAEKKRKKELEKKHRSSSGGSLWGVPARVNKAYGKGTKSATPGIHEIAENAPEIVRNNDGTAFLAKEHQLHDFEGGERVYNSSETKQLMDGTKSNIPVGNTSVGNTPINKINSLQNPDYLRLLQVVEDGLLAPLENGGFIRSAVSVKQPNLQSIQQTVNVTVNNTFPNVTNSGGYEQFNKNMTRFLSGAKLASLTFKNR